MIRGIQWLHNLQYLRRKFLHVDKYKVIVKTLLIARKNSGTRKQSLPKLNELDKLSSVANKLAKLEATSKEQIAEINELNMKLKKAQEELNVLKLIKMDRNEMEYKKIVQTGTELQNENAELKKYMMEKGFKWVGKNAPKPKSGLSEFQKEIDLELIAIQINKLNDQIEHDSKYTRGKDGAHRLAVVLLIIVET